MWVKPFTSLKETTDANGKTRIQTNVELVLTEENIDGYIGQYVKIKR